MQKHILFAGLLASLCGTGTTAGHAQSIDYLRHQHRALEMEARRCDYQFQHYSQAAQANAWRGGMRMVQPPTCMSEKPRIISQMALIETRIARQQGDMRSSCEITNTCQPLVYHPGQQPGYVSQRQRVPPSNQAIDDIVNNEEWTDKGNLLQKGPNGSYHWYCGTNAPNVTTQSYLSPGPHCVRQ